MNRNVFLWSYVGILSLARMIAAKDDGLAQSLNDIIACISFFVAYMSYKDKK